MTPKIKKIGAYTLAFVLLIFVALTVTPLVFKNKIKQSLFNLTDKKLNTKVQIENFEIGLFENFPNITFSLKNVTLLGINNFANDTLLQAKKISLNLDTKSLFSHNYDIKSIKITDSYIETKLDSEANFNWDILKVKSHQADTNKSLKTNINCVELTNTTIRYINLQSNSVLTLFDINAELSGEISAKTSLKLKAESKEVIYTSNGRSYISDIRIETETNIEADFENKIFSTKDSQFHFNKLPTVWNGSFKIIDAGCNFNINMKSLETDFSQLLSLAPIADSKEFKTSGSVNIEANLIGNYTATSYPKFNLSLLIDDARLQSSPKAKAIDDINLNLSVNANTNDFSIIIEKLNFGIGNDKVESNLSFTPSKNLTLEGMIKGKINLTSLKDILPARNSTLIDGDLEIDLALSMNRTSTLTSNNTISTFEGEGLLKSNLFSLTGNSNLKKFGALLNTRQLDSITTNKISIPFMIEKGTLYTKTFNLTFNNGISLDLGGYAKRDRSINYEGNINLPSDIPNGIISNIPFSINGTFASPKISLETQISTAGIITNLFKRSSDKTQNNTINK